MSRRVIGTRSPRAASRRKLARSVVLIWNADCGGPRVSSVQCRVSLVSTSVAPAASGHPPAVAELVGVKKTYLKPDGTVLVDALAGVDLRIGAGEYLAIMGAS